MAIWAMPKGGLGKITGSCVNVPASLEPIAEILPRVPENTQLVLVKLKRMLVYKSHYLCDYICPYVVMDALKFLKEHNPHYINVKIDETWIDKLKTDSLYRYVSEDVNEDMESGANGDTKTNYDEENDHGKVCGESEKQPQLKETNSSCDGYYGSGEVVKKKEEEEEDVRDGNVLGNSENENQDSDDSNTSDDEKNR